MEATRIRVTAAVAVLIISQLGVFAHTSIEFRKVTSGGTLKWLGNTLMPCGLPNDESCKVTVSSPQGSGIVAPTGTGFVLEAVVTGLIFQKVGSENQLGTSGSNYTFGGDYELRIISSDEYPQLNGRQVTLSGVTSDALGMVAVYFP